MPATPGLMYEHGLDVPKGWFHPAALDFSAKLDPAITDEVYAGSVVHVDADGEFALGITGAQMAIFLISGSTDFDVDNPRLTASGNFMQEPIAPTGVMTGLVATGAYELETTEFDTGQAYVPNETLTSTDGTLTNVAAVVGTNPVCGVVSRGASPNAHGIDTLSFWPVYVPV